MPRLTVTIDDDHEETLERLSGDGGEYESKSEAVRACIQQYDRTDDRVEDLEAEIEELEAAIERLENEKRLILEEREERQELVRYVEQERTVEQRWREAGLTTRMKWRLFGMPADA